MNRPRIRCTILLMGLLLGIHEGNIALWKNDRLIQEFPYPASMLPPSDQMNLQKGIPIENAQDLSRLLEGYLS